MMRGAWTADVPVLLPVEFERFSKLAYEHFGLDLSAGKQDLVAARLGKKLRELGLNSYQEYYDVVESDGSGEELAAMVDLLTTNHTSFFREPGHFDLLRTMVFPALRGREQKNSQIDIWSAACSSGEEPYSIAMTLLELDREAALSRVKIKATDISTRVLEKGRNGVYPEDRIEDIPVSMRRKYLLKGRDRAAGTYRFKPEVRAMVDFGRLNLMEELPEGYRCPVIFCRNIMIYFDRPTQQNLVGRLSHHLEAGGHLFIGHSESLNSLSHGLEYIAPATYRKPAAGSSVFRPDGYPLMTPVIVGIGDCMVSNDPSELIVTHALGSCIGVLVHDPVAKVAGLLHYMLPESELDRDRAKARPCVYADTGIPVLFQSAYQLGAAKSRMIVTAVGGAQMLDDNGTFNIGRRNHLAMRKIFWKAGVIVQCEEIGGNLSRTVSIEVATGRVLMRSPGMADQYLERAAARKEAGNGIQHTHRR